MNSKKTAEKKGLKIGVFMALALAMIVLSSANVTAIGITPGRVTLTFEPSLEQTTSVTIVNTEHKAMEISLSVEDDSANIVILNRTSLVFKAGEEQKTLTYKIKLPSSESEIGASGIKARIRAVEIAKNNNSGASIGVNIAVEQQIYVVTGILPETMVNITEGEKPNITKIFVQNYTLGEVAKIEIEILNPKNQTMGEVYSTLSIYDKSKVLRSQFNSTTESIAPKNKVTLAAFWDTNGFETGNYSGNLVVYYDNKTEEQKLMIQLQENSIMIDIGEFEEAEEKPPTTIVIEPRKRNTVIIVVIAVLVVFAIVELIVYIHFKRKAKSLENPAEKPKFARGLPRRHR